MPVKPETSSGQHAFSARIQGRVQGVGFRYSACGEARRLGLSGWVRNTNDGSVELYAEGPKERLASFLKWLHKGPPGSRVDSVDYTPCPPEGSYRGFYIHE